MKALHMHYSTHLLLYRFPYSFLIKRQMGGNAKMKYSRATLSAISLGFVYLKKIV